MRPPIVSCSTIVERDDTILLVEEGSGRYEGQLGLPGGGPKRREGLFDCAIRETAEETGLTVRPDRIVGFYQEPRTKAGNNLTRLVLAATVEEGEPQTSDRHPTVGFYTYDQIKELAKEKRLRGKKGTLAVIDDYRSGKGVGLDVLTILPNGKQSKPKNKKHS